MAISFVVVVSRLLVAALLGGLIGLERETAARGAGARTHALVALGSALFTIAGAYGFADAGSGPRDPSRIAAQVAAGVGFIGAGAVIRNGSSVSGVTTAATVWLAAAVGLAAAGGGVGPGGGGPRAGPGGVGVGLGGGPPARGGGGRGAARGRGGGPGGARR